MFILFQGIQVYAQNNNPSEWAFSYIEKVKLRQSLGERLFSNYQNEITRAEFAFLGVKIYEELTGKKSEVGDSKFIDTTDTYVLKAKNIGLVNGYPDGTFRPNQVIRRDELTKLFVDTLIASNIHIESLKYTEFNDDSKIGNWAKENVYLAKTNKIISGVGDNIFNPSGKATREESLIVFERALEKYKGSIKSSNSDVFRRILLTAGENPFKEVNITWQSVEDEGFIRIAEKVSNTSYLPHEYVELKGITTTVSSLLNKKQYVYQAHNIRLNNLKSNTEYIYVVGDGINWSKPIEFKTFKDDKIDKIGFYGDIQGYRNSHFNTIKNSFNEVANLLKKQEVNLFAGDLVNNSNALEDWLQLDKELGTYLSSNINVSAVGNHDANYGTEIFETTFLGPLNGVSKLENKNYYIEIENALILVIDTDYNINLMEQKKWLKSIAEKSEKPFKIVLMHRSAYPILYNELDIRNLSEIFEEANIDLVLSGHDHIYNRTTMLDNSKVDINYGVTYVVGGSSTGSKYYDEKEILGGRYWKNIVYDNNNPVFSTIEVMTNKLSFKAYAIEDGTKKLIDEFEIEKLK